MKSPVISPVISLERRFVTGSTLALLAVFVLLLWGAAAAVRSLSESHVLTRLEHDAEALLGAVGRGPHGQFRVREGRVTPIYQQPLSGHYFVIRLADGREVRSRSSWDATLALRPQPVGGVSVYRDAGPVGQHLLYRAAGYQKGDMALTLVVAEDLEPLDRQIARFQQIAIAVLLLALVLLVILQRFLLRRGFRDIDRVREEIGRVASGEAQRLGHLGPAEIRPLGREVNRLLAQLEQRLQRSRQALGNLAHALKAPLSLLTREIDTLPVSTEQRRHLARQLERVDALVARQLKRARFAGEGAGQGFMPTEQVPELLQALRQIHRRRQLDIQCTELPPGPLPFDRDDMLELLGNLLDNACKWADTRVELRLRVDRGLQVSVADDGSGIPEEAREALLQRGSRLDEEVGGHGLGLAIVKDLVRDYGGSLSLGRGALGGLEVLVELPLPESSAD